MMVRGVLSLQSLALLASLQKLLNELVSGSLRRLTAIIQAGAADLVSSSGLPIPLPGHWGLLVGESMVSEVVCILLIEAVEVIQ